MRLCFCGGIATDDRCGSPCQLEALQQRQREARHLVGDDSPGHASSLDFSEQQIGPGEETCVLAQSGFVSVEEGLLELFELWVRARDAHSSIEHSARAVGGV